METCQAGDTDAGQCVEDAEGHFSQYAENIKIIALHIDNWIKVRYYTCVHKMRI